MDMNELRDPQKLREYMIDEEMPQYIPFETEKVFDGNGLSYLQGVGNEVKIVPFVNIGSNGEVQLSISVVFKEGQCSVFKPCLGKGENIISALRMALDTARVTIFLAAKRMLEHDAYTSIETEFAGRKHTWKVYTGNVYTLKDNVSSESQQEVTKMLDQVLPDVIKRMGNQDLAGVFLRFSSNVFASMMLVAGSYSITEPMEKFVAMGKDWPGADKEMFLIIEQDVSTYSPTPLNDIGRNERMLNEYLDILRNTPDGVLSESEFEDAKLLIGDPTFVNCCRAFLPELSAMVMIPREIRYSDMVEIYTADGVKHDICLTQQTDFVRIRAAVYQVAGKSRGQDPIFRTLSDQSQIIRYIQETRMPPSERILIENYRFKFHMGDGFEFR